MYELYLCIYFFINLYVLEYGVKTQDILFVLWTENTEKCILPSFPYSPTKNMYEGCPNEGHSLLD